MTEAKGALEGTRARRSGCGRRRYLPQGSAYPNLMPKYLFCLFFPRVNVPYTVTDGLWSTPGIRNTEKRPKRRVNEIISHNLSINLTEGRGDTPRRCVCSATALPPQSSCRGRGRLARLPGLRNTIGVCTGVPRRFLHRVPGTFSHQVGGWFLRIAAELPFRPPAPSSPPCRGGENDTAHLGCRRGPNLDVSLDRHPRAPRHTSPAPTLLEECN